MTKQITKLQNQVLRYLRLTLYCDILILL